MISDIAQLSPLWQVLFQTIATNGTANQKILGADPRRWIVAFQLPNPAIGTTKLHPYAANCPLFWNLAVGTDTPIRIDQRDWGPLPAGEWYFESGGVFNVTVMQFIWQG